MAFHVTSTPEIDAWRSFVKKHPEGNIFHNLEKDGLYVKVYSATRLKLSKLGYQVYRKKLLLYYENHLNHTS